MPLSTVLIHVTITLLFDLAWASGFWMDWPERLYQQTKEIPWLWSWMDQLKIPKTEENCVRMIRYLCVLQIVVCTISLIAKIAFYIPRI